MTKPFHDPPTVMVVDDAVDAAEMAADVLQLAGYEVSVAFDGQDALERIAARCPDIVLMDIDMPRVDGYEAARSIRRSRPMRGPRVLVALSAQMTQRDVDRAIAAGFDAHLSKPLFGAGLVQAVECLIAAATVADDGSGEP